MANAANIFRYKKISAKSMKPRPNAYQRGYGGKGYDAARMRIFIRDMWKCQKCGRTVILKARDKRLRPHCDHIVPLAKGGPDEDKNKQTLCGSCHSVKTREENQGGGGEK
jgi:5-methylcytosine-specific restriction protein A